ncbi:hypothetical protein NY486_06745, partial [Enterobacter hormaechei]|nr:hypothetical protein [Enterobacter hormaechei]
AVVEPVAAPIAEPVAAPVVEAVVESVEPVVEKSVTPAVKPVVATEAPEEVAVKEIPKTAEADVTVEAAIAQALEESRAVSFPRLSHRLTAPA